MTTSRFASRIAACLICALTIATRVPARAADATDPAVAAPKAAAEPEAKEAPAKSAVEKDGGRVETAEGASEKPAAKPAAGDGKTGKKKQKKFRNKGGAMTPEAKDFPRVVITTSLGPFTLELFGTKAPETTKNFLKYVDEGFYDGTIFHRVIDGFMIQGGGFTPDMNQKKTHDPVKNEADPDVKNLRGTIAMARTNDPDSATAQFFVNVKDNSSLDRRGTQPGGYTVFGKVVEGMDVVDKIKAVKTGSKGMYDDVPQTPVVIKSAKRASAHH